MVSKWIDVNEALPCRWEHVLICANHGGDRYMFCGCWDGSQWTLSGDLVPDQVTHWRELPKPPFKRKTENRYDTDPEYRERMKAHARARYHRLKAERRAA